MAYVLTILRRKGPDEVPFWQSFSYEPASGSDTVATALTALEQTADLTDAEGNPADAPRWQSSCLQKKCGACAMVINGKPRIACGTKLNELGTAEIRLEPLRKFPVVCDLVVDRSILYENLRMLGLWLSKDADLSDVYRDLAYEASECIQCGCCLEVCPNFYAGGKFFGMATVPLTTRILSETDRKDYKELARMYAKHTFAGCGKSLACRDVCPKKIDTEKLLVNANALAVWKRRKKK